jgi:DNA-binding NarL/FixJ family response regulator
MHNLTGRQVQILADAMQGLTARESALRLQLSTSTVKHHRARIMRDLGADSMAHAVAIFLRSGGMDEPTTNARNGAVSA